MHLYLTTKQKRFLSCQRQKLGSPSIRTGPLHAWEGLCDPPPPHGGSAKQGAPATDHSGPGSISVDNQPWYPALLEMLIEPLQSSSHRGETQPSQNKVCTRAGATASRMAYLRQCYQSKKISEKGKKLLLASGRQKSSWSYNSLFRNGWTSAPN